jgi:hypothetical protein
MIYSVIKIMIFIINKILKILNYIKLNKKYNKNVKIKLDFTRKKVGGG